MLEKSHVLRFPVLRVLVISNNNFKDLGASAIARFIITSGGRTLTDLQMEDNNITEAGALELASAFTKAYAMRVICMTSNIIGPRGSAAIMDALATASTAPMDTIRFVHCQVQDKGVEAAGRLIARRGCRFVYLNANMIRVAGVKAIANYLATSACIIQHLNLSVNPLYGEGVKYLLDKMILIRQQQQSKVVCELDITDVHMEMEGTMAVKRAVEAHDVLNKLHVNKYNDYKEADKILERMRTWDCDSEYVMLDLH
ncbi:MAG: hypothetical protein P4L50_00535 [Anaerolineaceae bacterium]|nr:hypothetical protein [Anaerolineaceae bacterium]